MGYFSDRDILRALNKEIVIEPFDQKCLTPIGYDFRIGDYVFSLEHGLLEVVNGFYELPPKSTIQVLTKEALWVSSRVAGTFHSKVSLVSRGLSHISTTLDPLWYGPLLITFRNNTDNTIRMRPGDSFVTLLFSRVRTQTKLPHNKPSHRQDILLSQQLKERTDSYVEKITSVLDDNDAKTSFAEKVNEANKPMYAKVVASIRNRNREECLRITLQSTLIVIITVLLFLSPLWDYLSPYMRNIQYDSKVLAAQIGGVIASIAALSVINRKK